MQTLNSSGASGAPLPALIPCTKEPLSQHEDSTKNAYLCLLLSRMVPSAVMEMLRAPGLGQW